MIFVIHGDDSKSVYLHLQNLLNTYSNLKRQALDKNNNRQDLFSIVSTPDLFNQKKVIVCENFLSLNKISPSEIEKIKDECILIFWETVVLKDKILTKINQFAKIHLFKKQSHIFQFLDTFSPNAPNTIKALSKLPPDELKGILWQLSNRLLLLIIAHLNLNLETASKIMAKTIYDWQWSRIVSQSKKFNLHTLLLLNSGILKIDSIIKSGKTALDEKSLVLMLLLKYLK